MLLDQGVPVDVKINFIGGEQLLEFESIDAEASAFNVEVIVVVIVLIDDADAEGLGVSEGAVIDPVDREVVENLTVTA